MFSYYMYNIVTKRLFLNKFVFNCMEKIDELIQEHYIHDNYELENFIEDFYENKEDVERLKHAYKTYMINESKLNSKINRVVLIGEMRYKSLRKAAGKLDYADPEKLWYEIKEDKIKVDDGEYQFTLDIKDKEGTIIIVRSGYKNPNIHFLLSEMIRMGFLVINDPTYVNISNNKYLLGMLLKKYDIPQPKFILISHRDINKGDDKILQEKLKKLYRNIDDDTKFVCKILGGHGGKGVFICKYSNITSVLQAFFAIDEECQILVQEFCEIDGGDIRVNVITLNGKQEIFSVAMRNKSSDDFRTNLSLGNTLNEDIKLTPEQKKIALDTAKASGLVWCGVDLMPLKNGKTYVVEYNGSPGPMSDLNMNKEDVEKSNEVFYGKFLETINKMC